MKKIAVVGHGYVGKAVEYGFNTRKNKIALIDPALYGNSVDQIEDADVSFVCVPTPFGKDGKIVNWLSSMTSPTSDGLLKQVEEALYN